MMGERAGLQLGSVIVTSLGTSTVRNVAAFATKLLAALDGEDEAALVAFLESKRGLP